ncbi:hypothetical protein JANAI62_11810 [Jannaschia pagri]|uniref:Uncharacterized protein n=1 Tax=Jannaschia pagri TaxID=2829797 RepID=A0ABQ4NJG7_9RHOB|nr:MULTISPECIES: hypothetical protein [unclassified Jannaschia]GIT90726.1 hypothetical protein JANAI61_11840 [Jannaschia sp. AI_61]GIT94558.1 hypothetical protein JANAI62_11810 [Jannaschia sp. AI_62]
MFHHANVEMMQIETQARALRAAHTRRFLKGLFARLRGTAVPANV